MTWSNEEKGEWGFDDRRQWRHGLTNGNGKGREVRVRANEEKDEWGEVRPETMRESSESESESRD